MAPISATSCVLQKYGGDPAAECKKAFRVTYICGKNSKPETCALEERRARVVRTAIRTIFAFCIA
jgi:hypothetical protein